MILGLDIGGANLKAASSTGQARSQNFDLWTAPERLTGQLRQLLADFADPQSVALTMTAELADCFATKAEGVNFVLSAVEAAVGTRDVRVWHTGAGGGFLSVSEARRRPMQVAAANWLALATWAGRFAPRGIGLLCDIGSTTTDIIPLQDGVPCPVGLTDPARLQSGELAYTGVRRTPLCALATSATYRGAPCALAAELFATTLDVYLTLGDIPEDPQDCHTANGRPATIVGARDRLSRMFCCDREEFTSDDALLAAREFAAFQQAAIAQSAARVLERQPGRCTTLILSGSGSFLARKALVGQPVEPNRPIVPSVRRTDLWSVTPGRLIEPNCRIISLDEQLSPDLAESACAYAVSLLALQPPLV